MKVDNRITDCIAEAQPFAQPILELVRTWVHTYCPEVEETIKWNFPCFLYKGKIMCFMASHKKHCSVGFWLAPVMQSIQAIPEGMGILGKLTDRSQLPSEREFQEMVHEAMQLIDAGITNPKKAKVEQPLVIPDEMRNALQSSNTCWNNFNAFTKSQQKEYVDWYQDAKTEATREKRLDTLLEWIEEGKIRMWKYVRK